MQLPSTHRPSNRNLGLPSRRRECYGAQGLPCTVRASTRLILPRNNLAERSNRKRHLGDDFQRFAGCRSQLQDINEQTRAANVTMKTQSRAIGVPVAWRLDGPLGIRTTDARREMKNDSHRACFEILICASWYGSSEYALIVVASPLSVMRGVFLPSSSMNEEATGAVPRTLHPSPLHLEATGT